MPVGPLELRVGDIVEMRKPHPCGERHWRILRIGIDIGIECLGCKRYVLVPRRHFETKMKRFITRGVSEEDNDLPTEAS